MPLGDANHLERQRAAIAAFIATLETKPEFSIVSSIFNTSTPQDAVQAIVAHTTPLVSSPSDLETSVYDTACALLEIAKRTKAEEQGPLLEFVRALQKESLKNEEGEVVSVDGEEVWKDLPTFGYVFGDDVAGFDVRRTTYTPTETTRILNTHAFLAQLSSTPNAPACLDYFDAATTLLGETFGPWDVPTQPTNLAFRLASIWIEHLGGALWERVGSVEEGRESWARWKAGFACRAGSRGSGGSDDGEAHWGSRRAVERMEALERV